MSNGTRSPELPDTGSPIDLPEVTPPTAGFLIQLFGVPLGIVVVAVMVWLLFGKIAGSQRTTKDYLEDLHSPNFERRWSAARDLASLLPHNAEWQDDAEFARELALELDRQLASGPGSPTEIRYVHYIAETLGEFRSVAGIPSLRRALNESSDRDVREAAVMGLGKLADRLGGLNDAAAIADLIAATHDEDSVIRVKAAWILGRTANEQAIPGLIPLLGHSDYEVRLNAANSLARLGSTAGVEVFAEMINLVELRQTLEARGLTRSQLESQMVAIPWSALQSLTLLAQRSPDADLDQFRSAAELLAQTGTARVSTSAREFLVQLNSKTKK
jgi:HEAT repeat protein